MTRILSLTSAYSKQLMFAMISVALVTSGCDLNKSSRQRPARKAGAGIGAKQKDGKGGNGAQENKTDAQGSPLPNGAVRPSGNNPNSPDEGPSLGDDPVGSGTSPQTGLPPNSDSTTGSAGTKPPPTSPGNRGSVGTRGTGSPAQPRGAGTPDQQNSMENQATLEDLQKILTNLHQEVYLNAWLSITRDKASKPTSFFEDVAAKMQNFTPIISIKKGETPPASINQNCDKSRLIQEIDSSSNNRRLLLFDCSSRTYLNLLNFKKNSNDWTLQTTRSTLESLMPQSMGFLTTVSFDYKPRCSVTVATEMERVRIMKATCNDWGQEQSATKAKDRKTIFFKSIVYDPTANDVLVAEAHYIDYDDSNQLCRSGILRRKAPSSNKLILVEDEGDERCEPIQSGDPQKPIGVVPHFDNEQQATNPNRGVNPRGRPVRPVNPNRGDSQGIPPHRGQLVPNFPDQPNVPEVDLNMPIPEGDSSAPANPRGKPDADLNLDENSDGNNQNNNQNNDQENVPGVIPVPDVTQQLDMSSMALPERLETNSDPSTQGSETQGFETQNSPTTGGTTE